MDEQPLPFGLVLAQQRYDHHLRPAALLTLGPMTSPVDDDDFDRFFTQPRGGTPFPESPDRSDTPSASRKSSTLPASGSDTTARRNETHQPDSHHSASQRHVDVIVIADTDDEDPTLRESTSLDDAPSLRRASAKPAACKQTKYQRKGKSKAKAKKAGSSASVAGAALAGLTLTDEPRGEEVPKHIDPRQAYEAERGEGSRSEHEHEHEPEPSHEHENEGEAENEHEFEHEHEHEIKIEDEHDNQRESEDEHDKERQSDAEQEQENHPEHQDEHESEQDDKVEDHDVAQQDNTSEQEGEPEDGAEPEPEAMSEPDQEDQAQHQPKHTREHSLRHNYDHLHWREAQDDAGSGNDSDERLGRLKKRQRRARAKKGRRRSRSPRRDESGPSLGVHRSESVPFALRIGTMMQQVAGAAVAQASLQMQRDSTLLLANMIRLQTMEAIPVVEQMALRDEVMAHAEQVIADLADDVDMDGGERDERYSHVQSLRRRLVEDPAASS